VENTTDLPTREVAERPWTGTTGLRTWQASVRLANHLLAQPDMLAGKRILELGSGTGMLSILIAKIQQLRSGSLIATDHDEAVLCRLRANMACSKRA
jgi:predicted nicotinamide N-methyase